MLKEIAGAVAPSINGRNTEPAPAVTRQILTRGAPKFGNHSDNRYGIYVQSCNHCGRETASAKGRCDCGSRGHTTRRSSGRGVVYSYTTIAESAPEGYGDQAPYTVALIKLDDGVSTLGRVTDQGSIEIDDRVEMVIRKTGPYKSAYGPSFRKAT